jgi:hypothetical protein
MGKMFSEDGLIGEFTNADMLTNGDIFIRNFSYKGKQEKSKVVSLNKQQVVDNTFSSRPVPKAIPPEPEKPRLGLMCPHCHQSRIAMLSINPFSSKPIDEDCYIISSMEEDNSFLRIPMHKYHHESHTYDLSNKEEVPKFIRESDSYISIETDEHEWVDLATVVANLTKASIMTCPICRHEHQIANIQSWIDEYSKPSINYHDICKMCGGEMMMDCESGIFNAQASNQVMRCEDCGHEKIHKLGKHY